MWLCETGKYRLCSYHAKGLGKLSKLTVPHPVYIVLGTTDKVRQCNYRCLFSDVLDAEELDNPRKATQRVMTFGGNLFNDQIEN